MKKKGYFTLEAVIVLGLFLLIGGSSLFILSSSLKVQNKIWRFSASQMDYRKNIDYFIEEIKEGKDIEVFEKKLSYYITSIEGKNIKITYSFLGINLYRRESDTNQNQIFLENTNGSFNMEDGFLRLKIIIDNKEEEYVFYIK